VSGEPAPIELTDVLETNPPARTIDTGAHEDTSACPRPDVPFSSRATTYLGVTISGTPAHRAFAAEVKGMMMTRPTTENGRSMGPCRRMKWIAALALTGVASWASLADAMCIDERGAASGYSTRTSKAGYSITMRLKKGRNLLDGIRSSKISYGEIAALRTDGAPRRRRRTAFSGGARKAKVGIGQLAPATERSFSSPRDGGGPYRDDTRGRYDPGKYSPISHDDHDDHDEDARSTSPVPEPGAALLFAVGLAAVALPNVARRSAVDSD
jgi:hypothetical protein